MTVPQAQELSQLWGRGQSLPSVSYASVNPAENFLIIIIITCDFVHSDQRSINSNMNILISLILVHLDKEQ